MDYVIHPRWLGMHGDILVERAGGELLYVVKASQRYRRHWPVLDAAGNEMLHVDMLSRTFSTGYRIRSGEHLVGEAGSRGCMSEGYVNAADLPMVHCRFGWWGMMPLKLLTATGDDHVATLTSRWGLRFRFPLQLHDDAFDQPAFLVGCSLVVRDYLRRG